MQGITGVPRFVLHRRVLSYNELRQIVKAFDKGTEQLGNETKIVPVTNDKYRQERIIERNNKPLTLA